MYNLITDNNIRCHVCNNGNCIEIDVPSLYNVTSDCKPWKRNSRFCICQICGCLQKLIDSGWQNDADMIYKEYSIYYQSDGVEQVIFDEKGNSSFRSMALIERLIANIKINKNGMLLDVGCGNGALLRSFNKLFPFWSLSGLEINEKYKEIVESIDNIDAFYTDIDNIENGKFNLITMIHLLEHIVSPLDFLIKIRDKLIVDGLLMIELPNYNQNPFDLIVADHCTHFTNFTITNLLNRAGFDVICIAADWIPKELTLIAKKLEMRMDGINKDGIRGIDSIIKNIQWLESIVTNARQISKNRKFGLFGTSINATWLFVELKQDGYKNPVRFFVDEDENKVRNNKKYMGCPVYYPKDVPVDSDVFVASPTIMAKNIQARMKKFNFNCYIPS